MKVYKIISQNTNLYYISYTDKKYISTELHCLIKKYKKNTLKDNSICIIFNYNDISFIELFESEHLYEIQQFINAYKQSNDNFIIENNENIIHENYADIRIIKQSNNKNNSILNQKQKTYYDKNRYKLAKKSLNRYYKIKKENEPNSMSMNINEILND